MRKSPFVLVMVILACVGFVMAANADQPKLEKGELKTLRKQLANKPRRIIYNDDGCHGCEGTTIEDWLAVRLRQVVDTQVDTVSYCTGGGGVFWAHQPKVGEALGAWVEPGHAPYVHQMQNILETLKEQGTDRLAEAVKYGHQNKMEMFWSYRMNNPECSFAPWCLSKRKREHPEYIMGVKSDHKKYPLTEARSWYTLNDYERPEVRDHIVAIFEDVCQRYDVDGVELDFIRHPMYFRTNLDYMPATPAQVAMMTDMVRRIREITERESIKRGRPILLTVRAPLSVESCKAIGIDIETYLKDDLMDIMIAGQDYIQMAVASSLKDMVDLGHKYDVPVYALLVPPKPYDLYRNDNRAWYAAAMNRWYWGADGIYLFNLFPTKPNVLFSQLGSVESLKGRDKIYAIDNPVQESVLGTFKLVMVGPNRLPLTLVPEKYATIKLPVGEDIVANAPQGKSVSTLLRFQVTNLVQGDTLKIRFNGHLLPAIQPTKPLGANPSVAWFHVEVDPQFVKPGYNPIAIKLDTKRSINAISVLNALDLVVTYGDK